MGVAGRDLGRSNESTRASVASVVAGGPLAHVAIAARDRGDECQGLAGVNQPFSRVPLAAQDRAARQASVAFGSGVRRVRRSAAWPAALIPRSAFTSVPSGPITNVERSMPIEVRP
jgi:hypothetical protein